MALISPDLVGYELTWAAHKEDIGGSKTDAVIAGVHWRLVIHAKLVCCGKGDHFSGDDGQSEVLPDQWNQSGEDGAWCFKYRSSVKKADKYLLKVIKSDGAVIVNLLRFADEKVATITFDLDATITENGKYLKDKKEFAMKVDSELLGEFVSKEKLVATSEPPKKCDDDARSDPLRVGPSRQPAMPFRDPTDIGSSDLDPLGRMGGGGMILDPMGSRGRQGMPRFDPVHPNMPHLGRGLGPRRNFGDAMRPPDFDDMFS